MKMFRIGILMLMLVPVFTQASTAVPVSDDKADAQRKQLHEDSVDVMKGVGTKFTKAIENQNKILGELLAAQTNEVADKIRMGHVLSQKRDNAEKWSRDAGAKSMSACGLYKRSKAVAAGNVSRNEIKKELDTYSRAQFSVGESASVGEPQQQAAAQRALNNLFSYRQNLASRRQDMDGSLTDENSGTLSIDKSGKASKPDYLIEANRLNTLINPFPDAVPPGYDMPTQPVNMLIANAKSAVKNERLFELASIANKSISSRVSVYDKDWARNLFVIGEKGTVLNRAAVGNPGDKQGYLANLQTANRFRIYSDDWGAMINSGNNQIGLMKEMVGMQAASLANEQEIINALHDLIRIMTISTSVAIESNGKSDANSTIR